MSQIESQQRRSSCDNLLALIDLDKTNDPELLRAVAKIQDAEIRRLHQKLSLLTQQLEAAKGSDAATIQARLALLEKELTDAQKRAYNNGSERRPRPKESDSKVEKKDQKGHGPTPQPELPIKEVLHELDAADMICTSCGGQLSPWEGQFEESEEIDVVDIQYVLKKHRRQKYRCGCGGCVETALPPPKLIKGGRYSLGFAIHVALEKYGSHLPLERQVKRMARSGLRVESQTLWDQLLALSRCFSGARDRLHKYLLSKDVLMADETRWPVLGVSGRSTKNWFDWVLVAEDAVLHSIMETRSNEAADALLQGFKGVLLTDAYIVYASRAAALGFTHAHDWCHARRYFVDAEPTAPEVAPAILDEIGTLFLIEREIAEKFDGLSRDNALALRLRLRQEKSKPVVEKIGAEAMKIRALAESPIGRAVKYLENQWPGLIRFLDDPRIPITSNAAEGALRSPVLGRNNYVGSKSKLGTEVAATFYSLIESARINGLDPARYLAAGAEASLRGQPVPLPHELKQISLSMALTAPLTAPAVIETG